jgi:hypothetical protein
MRFEPGQAYVCTENGRMAVVSAVRDGGRAGLLRFGDTGAEEWFLWQQLHQANKWHRIDRNGWYIERYSKNGRRPQWTATVAEFGAVKALVEDTRAAAKGEIVRVTVPVTAADDDRLAFIALGVQELDGD